MNIYTGIIYLSFDEINKVNGGLYGNAKAAGNWLANKLEYFGEWYVENYEFNVRVGA